MSFLTPLWSQQIFQYENKDARIYFFSPTLSQHVPHITRMHAKCIALHDQIWNTDSNSYYKPDKPSIVLTDWEDDGNASVASIPTSLIQIGIEPINMSFYVSPTMERYHHLFAHEQTHVVMTDKATKADMGWRKFCGGKVAIDALHPVSSIWSYFTSPRWYSPRWYQEGIACFLETWLGGGEGRAMGGYDEMYFRSLVHGNAKMSSVVGLESEGSTTDFQLGTNAYLYGTRFVNYLVLRNGFDTLITFYNRTEGTSRLFARQFKKTYDVGIRKMWKEWQQYEVQHQNENLTEVRKYPITTTHNITRNALGSVANPIYDAQKNVLYTAINHPGKMARLVRIDMESGKIRKLHTIDGPRLYATSYLAFDNTRRRLIYTTHNQGIRGLRVYDLQKHRLVKRMNFQRLSNLVYDNVNDCMYALLSNQGAMSLVRLDSTLQEKQILYMFPFGVSICDLAISHDGKQLSATLSGNNGEHKLILFQVEELDQSIYHYETIATFESCNLSNFSFSLDDQYLIGSSYYTGVSNLWRIHIASKKLDLLTNCEIGIFAPTEIAPDSLLALQFERNGMRPVTLKVKVLEDAKAIDFLGQKVYDHAEKRLSTLCQLHKPLPHIEFGKVTDSIKPYHPIREMHFISAYPDLTGFVDREALNSVTPVLGYYFHFQDPIGLSKIELHLGTSAWSHNDWINRFHVNFSWKYRLWTLTASWNRSNFYDLVGPIQASRKGYSVCLGYNKTNLILAPLASSWGVNLATYGLMDVLPTAQNIAADIRSMQTISAYYHIKKVKRSLGAITNEQGWELGADGFVSLVNRHLYPTLLFSANGGVLLPFLRNTSLWLRNGIGHNFGHDNTPFSFEYFGGFQANYLEYTHNHSGGMFNYYAMPGIELNAIPTRYFAHSQLQLYICPIRFNNFGTLAIYPTWLQFSPFAGYLFAESGHYLNYGLKISAEIVLFNYMRTTWSIGYARANAFTQHSPFGRNSDEWLFSIKLF